MIKIVGQAGNLARATNPPGKSQGGFFYGVVYKWQYFNLKFDSTIEDRFESIFILLNYHINLF